MKAKKGEEFVANRKGIKFSWIHGWQEPVPPSTSTINRKTEFNGGRVGGRKRACPTNGFLSRNSEGSDDDGLETKGS